MSRDMNSIPHFHIRYKNGGVVTYAVDWPKGADRVEFSVSACSPEDHFIKRLGWHRSVGMFYKKSYKNFTAHIGVPNPTWRDVKGTVIEEFRKQSRQEKDLQDYHGNPPAKGFLGRSVPSWVCETEPDFG